MSTFRHRLARSGHRLLNCHRRMIFRQLLVMLLLLMLLCARLAPPLRLAAPLLRKLQRVARRRPPMLLSTPPSVRLYTTAQTLTAQSLVLLSRQPASPQSSSHSSVHHWLESTENMAPPPGRVNAVQRPLRTATATATAGFAAWRRCYSPRALLPRHTLLRALPATRDAAPLLPLLLKFWVFLEKC